MANTYSIDADSLIRAWRRDYPPDVFPSVWQKLSDLAEGGRVVSCEEVLLELKRREDDLHEWAKERDYMFRPPDRVIEEAVAKIVNQWPEFVPEDSHDGVWADPYVIGVAIARTAMVVTNENRVGENAKMPKIPNICDSLGVTCIRFVELLRYERLQF